MSQVPTFAILGLASGALYVLISLGLVIIHRVSKIVNYAQGAFGMVGTYVFWDLNQRHHVAYGVALVVGVAVSAAVGLLTELLVMRPLGGAAPVTRMIATLGVLTVLQQGVARHYDTTTITVPSELPTSTVKVLGATIGWNQLIIIAIAMVVSAGLAWLYQGTGFGRQTSAAAENPRGLALLGHAPGRISAVNWAVAGGLAGLAGILLAPLTGLDVTQFTLLVLPALAGAVVGRLASFPLTVLGGLAIGVIQSEMGRYIERPGWSGAAPFLVIVVLLVVRGRDEQLRSRAAEQLPRLGTGRIRVGVVIAALVLTVVLVETIPISWTDALITTVTSAVVLLSLVVVTGYSGQLSLAQFAFAGWGAWVAGRLVADHGAPFWLACLVGVVAALPLGLLVGVICLRTQGINLSIATLAFAVGMEQILFNNPDYTGGLGGTVVGNPTVFGFDIDAVLHNDRYAILCVAVFTLAALALANLRKGATGRRLVAVRANERAAASLGVGVVASKLYAFCLASLIASAGGILLAFRNPTVVFDGFNASASIAQVSQVVVGGVGWLAGPLLGGLLTVGSLVTEALDELGSNVAVYLPLVGGVLLLLTLVTAPDGLAYNLWRQMRAVQRFALRPLRRKADQGPSAAATEIAAELAARPADPSRDEVRVLPRSLDVRSIGVSYGGVRALDDVSLSVRPGEVVGLIGPNGAGKTTFIDAVTGFANSDGTLTLGEETVGGWGPTRLARAGLGRSFQSLELFDDMTVLDNLRVAAEPRRWHSYVVDLIRPRTSALTPIALAAVEEFGLVECLDRRPSDLPYGMRRLVGIARAVAAAPSVLLLDEPAAGLDSRESAELGALIRRLADAWGMSVLLVEHDVQLVMSVCDRIVALNFGRSIATGTPAEIRRSPAVVEAYLGAADSTGEDADGPRLSAGDTR